MRVPVNDHDSDSFVSSDLHPEAGPSSMTTTSKNGHGTNGTTNGFSGTPVANGVMKHGKPPVSKVKLHGTTLYEDSHIDREEYIRLVIQSLRDVGYMYASSALILLCI